MARWPTPSSYLNIKPLRDHISSSQPFHPHSVLQHRQPPRRDASQDAPARRLACPPGVVLCPREVAPRGGTATKAQLEVQVNLPLLSSRLPSPPLSPPPWADWPSSLAVAVLSSLFAPSWCLRSEKHGVILLTPTPFDCKLELPLVSPDPFANLNNR